MYSAYIKGVDKSSLLKTGTLLVQKGADNRNSCSLSLITTSSYVDVIGHDLQVKDGSTVVFGGVIKTVRMGKLEPGAGSSLKLKLDITSDGYSDIPSRRTTSSTFTEETTAGAIVTAMLGVLNATGADDNIGTGTISDGATIPTYSAVCKSVKGVLDDMASASGFKWYIDDSRNLQFIAEDTVSDAAHDIVESGAFTDFFITDVSVSLAEYRNKQIVRGAQDTDGSTIEVAVTDDTEISARQTAEGSTYSSGVYGNVIEDTNIKSDADATTAANNALKRYGTMPYSLSFRSFTNDWVAGTKLKVNLPTFGISSDTYYLIESVTVEDIDGTTLETTVTATKRKSDSFSTQRTENYKDYFGKLIDNSKLSEDDNKGNGKIFVQDDEPTSAPAKSVWVDTNDYSRYDIVSISTATTLEASGEEVVLVSGTTTVTLFTAAGNTGVIRIIKNIGSDTVTIDGDSSETIDGSATKTLTANQFCQIISDGTNWQVIG